MPTSRSRLLPPPIPSVHVERGAASLAEAMARRLTVVVAGAGYGKSTLLAGWTRHVPSAWYALARSDATAMRFGRGLADALPLDSAVADELAGAGEHDTDALASLLLDALDRALDDDLLLVVDDVHELPRDSGAARLLRALVRQAPPLLHVALGSRAEPPFSIERLRGQGQVLALTAAELSFSVDEVAQLVESSLDASARDLAAPLHELTGGWPAAVRLAVESLRTTAPEERRRVLDRAGRPGGAIYGYLTEEVLRSETPATRRLLEGLAPLDAFTPELCASLGLPRAEDALDALARRGLFLDAHGTGGGWMRLHALVREAVLERLDDEEVRDVRRTAARWLESRGFIEDAVHAVVAAGDADACVQLLREHGLTLIEHGAYDEIVAGAALLPDTLAEPRIEEVVGDAYHCLGDDRTARVWIARAEAHSETISGSLRFRRGVMHPDRPRDALRAWDPDPADDDPWNGAILSYAGIAACELRDPDTAADYARRALELIPGGIVRAEALITLGAAAQGAGDVPTAIGRYREAREVADAHGTRTVAAHARLRLAYVAYTQGRYDDAVALAGEAASLTRLAIFTPWIALIRGSVLFQLGRLEEALAELEGARAQYARLGYLWEAEALAHMGGLHLERGAVALGRAVFERAVPLAEESEVRWLLTLSLSGLARALAFDDPEEARRLARRALQLVPGSGRGAETAIAAGWVAHATGDADEAAGLAAQAVGDARRAGADGSLAEALELQAACQGSVPLLRQALALHEEHGSALGQVRVALALAHRDGSAATVERAERRLRALGIRPDAAAGAAGPYTALPPREDATVAISTLGGFRVVRSGTPVRASEWQSRKARDLLKLLVAHRGRPVARDVLMEALWPEDDPTLLSNRLSVLLSTVRTVLDPDRALPSDHFLAAHAGAVALQLAHLRVDAERFLALAEEGLALERTGSEDAVELLEAAEETYGGDFLQEDLYEDWAAPLRDEARATYVSVARVLAARAEAAGDLERAIRYRLRVLERDPFDEDAHLALVGVLRRDGRHGEARRRYVTYTRRMEEIGVEPAPFPAGEPAPVPAP